MVQLQLDIVIRSGHYAPGYTKPALNFLPETQGLGKAKGVGYGDNSQNTIYYKGLKTPGL
jgi:hypothetical protein